MAITIIVILKDYNSVSLYDSMFYLIHGLFIRNQPTGLTLEPFHPLWNIKYHIVLLLSTTISHTFSKPVLNKMSLWWTVLAHHWSSWGRSRWLLVLVVRLSMPKRKQGRVQHRSSSSTLLFMSAYFSEHYSAVAKTSHCVQASLLRVTEVE